MVGENFPIKAVVFDFNGVLDNMNAERLNALRDVLQRVGDFEGRAGEVLVDIEMIDRYHSTDSMRNIVTRALAKFFKKNDVHGFDPKKMAGLYAKKRKKYRKSCDGLKSVLKYLRSKGMKLFIVSHSKKADITGMFSKQGISENFFEKIYSTQELRLKKPSTEILNEMMSENGLKAGECVFIGDSVVEDLLPAKVVGMRTVLVSEFVDEFITSLRDVKKII